MTGANRPWPPLVIADHVPRLVRWRDFLLTLLMWIAFAIMLETEFELFFGDHLERLGLGNFDTEANWPIFFERLTPFLVTIVLLISLLVVASVLTLRRRRRALSLPSPDPLELVCEARRAGLDAPALTAARALRVAVVHIETDGTYRIEPR
jgi:hypothetical protein